MQKVVDRVSFSSVYELIPICNLFDQAQYKFTSLERYAQCWPVTDLIRMRLKYTSSRERRLKAFRVAEDIAQAVVSPKPASKSLGKTTSKTK